MRRGELRSYSALFSGIEEMLFSLDACCLFTWHVLAIIPLITGCSGIEALFHSLNSRGRAWCLLVDFLGVLAIHTLPGLWVQGLAPAYEFPKTSQVASMSALFPSSQKSKALWAKNTQLMASTRGHPWGTYMQQAVGRVPGATISWRQFAKGRHSLGTVPHFGCWNYQTKLGSTYLHAVKPICWPQVVVKESAMFFAVYHIRSSEQLTLPFV